METHTCKHCNAKWHLHVCPKCGKFQLTISEALSAMEEFLEETTDPYYNGEVDYGDRAEHCWNGDQTRPNALSRLRYNQMFIPKAVERMEKTAPSGADLKSWRY